MSKIELNLLCRLCLEKETGETMHQIFEECLNNKIIIMTGLDLLPNDSLPKKICKSCRYQLEQSYYFRLLAKQSDTKLRKYARLTNQKKDADHIFSKDYKDDDIEELEEHMMESHKYFDEVKVQALKEKQKALEEELNQLKTRSTKPSLPFKVQPSPEKPFIILNKCPVETPEPKKAPKLVRKSKPDVEEIQVVSASGEEDQRYEIEILETECADVGEVEVIEQFELITDDHLVKKRTPVKKNAEQQAEFYCRQILDDEKIELDKNGEKKIFQCAFDGCEEAFARRQLCKTHYYNHLAPDSQYSCRFCEKKFKVASALERHERVHTNSKPFICEICDKGFSQKEMLKRHIPIHLPKDHAPFECKICSERFRQKEPLKQHVKRVHAGNAVSFNCTHCDKTFAHSSGLSRHLLIHSGKIFKCKSCQRPFTDKSALKRHETTHSKDKAATKGKNKKTAAQDDDMEFD